MKRLHIGSSSLITGDEIADAVLELTVAMIRDRDAEIVDIPFVDEGGVRGRAQLVVGGAPGAWTTPISIAGPDPVEQSTVDRLRARAAMAPSAIAPFGEMRFFDPSEL